jgi:Fic family protein
MTIWAELHKTYEAYKALNLNKVLNYENSCMVSVVWHSTKIEGCSLTETDTKVLLEQDITAAGKPLRDHLMVKDHYAAFLFIQEQAKLKRKLSPAFIQEIAALVMKNTGGPTSTVMGTFDSSKGDLRLAQVYVDQKYFPDYSKVPNLLTQFCDVVNARIDDVSGIELLQLAADAHYNFINIHPFGDGNGRTGRLLLNYIQLYHQEPLVKIFTEDRAEYIDALNLTEQDENLDIFRTFIAKQTLKFLQAEIKKHQNLNKGFMLMF